MNEKMEISWFHMLLICAFVGLRIVTVTSSIGCKDTDGNPVDWFIVYKLPQDKDSPEKNIHDGLAYYYLDVNRPEWVYGEKSLNESGQAVYHTLDQIYKNYKSQDVMYLVYNDETPEKLEPAGHGHTKGDLAFDHETGFWLVHSLPRFPPYINSSYSYPPSGRVYGQTFLCVTYPYSQLNVIGKQLLYNHPGIYDYNLPSSFIADNPNIAAAAHDKYTSAKNNTEMLKSVGGQQFRSFAKSSRFHADLYHDWVAGYYRSDLAVETWLNGAGRLPSNCSDPEKVMNIEDVQVGNVKFKSSKDHSKWTVALEKQWMCIGDINREISQEHRQGGTVCFNIPTVWTIFSKSVMKMEKCSTPKISLV